MTTSVNIVAPCRPAASGPGGFGTDTPSHVIATPLGSSTLNFTASASSSIEPLETCTLDVAALSPAVNFVLSPEAESTLPPPVTVQFTEIGGETTRKMSSPTPIVVRVISAGVAA